MTCFFLTFSAKGIERILILGRAGWRRRSSPPRCQRASLYAVHGIPRARKQRREEKGRCCFYSCNIDLAIPTLANRHLVRDGAVGGGEGGRVYFL